MDTAYPRVLIVNGQSMYEGNATGITLRNLFALWPTDRVLEVVLHEPREYCCEGDSNAATLVVPYGSQPMAWLFRRAIGPWLSPGVNQTIVVSQRMGNIRRARRIEAIKRTIQGYLDASPMLVCSRRVLGSVDGFKPDVIYTMGAAIPTLRLALFFSHRYQCGIVLHFMDNWRDTAYRSCLLLSPVRRLLDRCLDQVEQRSQIGLAISDKMASEYAVQSGIPYRAIMNCVESDAICEPTVTENNPVVFSYVGGLHLNRWRSLLEVDDCMKTLRESGLPVSLRIYTKDTDRRDYEQLFSSNVTQFMDYLTHEEVGRAYSESDVLLHVESFADQDVKFTAYSISTKIPEYMASGRPILCYCPSTLAVYDYINATGSGVAVSNRQELLKWIETLARSRDSRLEFAGRGVETVAKSHTREAVHDTLREALNIAASGR